MTTAILNMAELVEDQYNPHLTYNSNLEILDTLVQLTVINMSTSAPPGSPVNGDRYIPKAIASGAWTGYENYIAYYLNGWKFIAPDAGWVLFNVDDATYYNYTGSAWVATQMTPELLDTVFRVVKSTDTTAKMRFDISKVATATTRSFIMPDGDVEFAKTKLDATTGPVGSNDSTEGYEPGSVWVDVTNDKGYLCVDNTATAAIWREMASATGSGDVLAFTTSTDNAVTRYHSTSGTDIQDSGVYIDDNDALYGHYAKLSSEKTASYLVVAADAGTVIVCNHSSAITVTLDDAITTLGFQVVIVNRGAGTVTIAVEGSDTLESKNSLTDLAQYSSATALRIASGVWAIYGDLE